MYFYENIYLKKKSHGTIFLDLKKVPSTMLARNCLSLEISFPPRHLMIKVNAFLSSTFPQNIKRILFEQQQQKNIP